MSIKPLLAAALLIAIAPHLRAIEEPSDQQLLDSILTQHNFLQAAPAPFLMEAEFTGQGIVPIKGRLGLRWQSPDHWFIRVDYGPFQQVVIRNGEDEYIARNFEFTPLQVDELFSLFNIGASLAPPKADKSAFRVDFGVPSLCVQGTLQSAHGPPHDYCADPATHDLLNDSWSNAEDQTHREHFSDYVESDGFRYPRRLDMFTNSSKSVSATITLFQPSPFDPLLLDPPKGAIERRRCASLKPPTPISRKNIDFGNHRPRMSQNVLGLTVLADGSVSDIHILESGGSLYDKPALAALNKWKFKPATCGAQPVVDDITIEIDYRSIQRMMVPRYTISSW